jgi:CheY-like chemotaxis protein
MGRAKILIVEDDLVTQRTLVRKLGTEDREITCVTSASDAIRAVQAGPPDLMILDLTLFEEDPFHSIRDGFGALAWLRRSLPDLHFPVIVYTANKSPNVDTQARNVGVFRVLRKTPDVHALLDAVCEALNVREAA